MKRICKKQNYRGIALIATLIFIGVFMAMAVGMITMSSHNAIASSNLQTSNMTRSTAESGMEMVRYWMNQVPASLSASTLYNKTLDDLVDRLDDAEITYVRSGNNLHIGPVILNEATNRSFEAWVFEDFT